MRRPPTQSLIVESWFLWRYPLAVPHGIWTGNGVTVDWDGQPRPNGVQPDLGATEYSAATPPSAPQNLRIVR
jgi:hypothetical protein